MRSAFCSTCFSKVFYTFIYEIVRVQREPLPNESTKDFSA